MAEAALKVSEKTDKADATRQRILNAAAGLFRDRGYATVNLREIAAKAGMKAGSLYYHFDSKESIVIEVLDTGIEAVHDAVHEAMLDLPEGATAADKIRQGILTHLRSLFEFNHYTSANVRIYSQVPPTIRKANLKARRAYESLWEGILEDIDKQGVLKPGLDLKNFRLLLISSLNATLEWFDPKRGDLNELADSYASMLLNGVLKD